MFTFARVEPHGIEHKRTDSPCPVYCGGLDLAAGNIEQFAELHAASVNARREASESAVVLMLNRHCGRFVGGAAKPPLSASRARSGCIQARRRAGLGG